MTATLEGLFEQAALAGEKVRSKRLELAALTMEREQMELQRTQLRYKLADRLQKNQSLSASAALERARTEPEYGELNARIGKHQLLIDQLGADVELAQLRATLAVRRVDAAVLQLGRMPEIRKVENT